jgi:5-methylthioadenosine/S-adenosylhomocysteine deaminase
VSGDHGTLIQGRHVLTSGDPSWIQDGAVRVVGSTVSEVGSWEDLRKRYPGDDVVGGPHDIVTPGFINTHGHFSEALITGIAKQHTLWEWIGALVAPAAAHLDRQMAHVGTLLAGVQMLQTGITTTNDMFVCDPDGSEAITPGVVDGLDELGLRGVVSFGAGDVRGASVSAIMSEHEALLNAASASDLATFRVGIAALGAQSDALFAESVRLAGETGGSHLHLQEIREEVTAIRGRHGVTPVEYCAQEELFESPTIAAHCVWVDANDRQLLADYGVGVAHNPVSNMILASGVCPVRELRDLGVSVGIGVDGPASNDRQDMLEAIKMAPLLQRVSKLQATALSAREAFAMATIEGATALGIQYDVGSLEPGKSADLVVFDGGSAALANVHDPFESVVYVAGPRDVKDVFVGGKHIVDGGAVVTVDVDEIVERSRPMSRRLVERAKL